MRRGAVSTIYASGDPEVNPAWLLRRGVRRFSSRPSAAPSPVDGEARVIVRREAGRPFPIGEPTATTNDQSFTLELEDAERLQNQVVRHLCRFPRCSRSRHGHFDPFGAGSWVELHRVMKLP